MARTNAETDSIFVTWPVTSLPSGNDQLVECVDGLDDAAMELAGRFYPHFFIERYLHRGAFGDGQDDRFAQPGPLGRAMCQRRISRVIGLRRWELCLGNRGNNPG